MSAPNRARWLLLCVGLLGMCLEFLLLLYPCAARCIQHPGSRRNDEQYTGGGKDQ
jgi:hypothetical protein